MNLRNFGLKAVALAAVVAAGALSAAPSTQAAAIRPGDTIDISNEPGFGVLVIGSGFDGLSPVVDKLDFAASSGTGQIKVTGGTGGFVPYIGKVGTIQDLTFMGGVSVPVNAFLDIAPDLLFDLSSATVLVGSKNGNFRPVDVELFGNFRNAEGSILGQGLLTAQLRWTNPGERRSYSISAEAVPTPALLPGLMAMGAAALRKRREAEEETLDAEV
ncbi:PTPA-CTERM sorting domain-containing protein [Thermoleptolyngbya sichuanensis A183]|uniref:PTPA-CTERM sorting domain-containing protein n=1 Tax=Thermoleptolyngbya sichuanensis A183 TaxID=2737172 RepID=A0A6M8B912_9CYAN|nr:MULTISPECIES: PTPA-CTERM sorting domain-containing protein [Thermoleptolyngbya]QKD83899.1 PTPA-CTERM sorting domain-containing protein [Thermoleptolyngbya sichuanensis A183]